MQMYTNNATKYKTKKGMKNAYFSVYHASQFSKYIVRRDPILDVETLLFTHQIKTLKYEYFKQNPEL